MFKKFLQEKNISIYKLSEISNVPYTTLNELANGKKNIQDCKIKTIQGIANSLGISIEAFLNLFSRKKIFLSDSWEKMKERKYLILWSSREYGIFLSKEQF